LCKRKISQLFMKELKFREIFHFLYLTMTNERSHTLWWHEAGSDAQPLATADGDDDEVYYTCPNCTARVLFTYNNSRICHHCGSETFARFRQLERVVFSFKSPLVEQIKSYVYSNTYIYTEKGDSCSICLNLFEFGDQVHVTNCKHTFHAECILRWLENSNDCPLCRQALRVKTAINKILTQ
jgi:hypothetical protein